MLWEYLREEEFEEAIMKSGGVCAMALGCLEKHGQHLPVGTDVLKTKRILEIASEIEPVCVFPSFYFGDIQGLYQHNGSIVLSGALLQTLMTELCDEIARNGFKKILLLNGHGGNIAFLDNFIRTTLYKKKDYVVFRYFDNIISPAELLEIIAENRTHDFPDLTQEDIEVMENYVAEKKFDGHGGFGETAGMLGTYPELVRMDKSETESGMSTHRFDHLSQAGIYTAHSWNADYPNSYAGNAPVGCNQRIADAYTKITVERIANVLRILKSDHEVLKFNDEWNQMW